MAEEGNPVCGGVLLLHTESGGKHSYQVNGFLNSNRGMFASMGDKLVMVNNTDVEDLTPKALAELLVEGSPLLTIHHPHKGKTEECESEEINVCKKEPTVMRFSLMMVREEDLDAAVDETSLDLENIEDDCLNDGSLLLVSMTDTSFSKIAARGCDSNSPCNSCGGMNCEFHDVVIVPTITTITFNSSRILRQVREQNNLYLQSFIMKKYVTPENQHMFLKDTRSAKITLYYYAGSTDCRGSPVVLNFTDTENFFCCTTKQGEDKKMLTLVSHNKRDLQRICPDDQEKWSLVFYMSSGQDGLRRFESALYSGWFIYTQSVGTRKVDMHKEDQFDSKQDSAFSFMIQSEMGSC